MGSEQQGCLADCCAAFATAGCADYEWPNALRTECALANQSYLACTGFCLMLPGIAAQYHELQSHPGCVPSCAWEAQSMPCGATNGCGGTCAGPELCSLLARRPELVPVLMIP